MDPQPPDTRANAIMSIVREAMQCGQDRAAVVAKLCRRANISEAEIWKRLQAHEQIAAIKSHQNAPDTGINQATRYAILNTLAHGSQGMVCLATDAVTGKQVAIKFLSMVATPSQLNTHPEVHALHTLAHPGLVRLADTNHIWSQKPTKPGDPHEGWFYIATEYVVPLPETPVTLAA